MTPRGSVHPGVSIVILNWNGRTLLAECLPSITEATRRYPGPTQVLVVDNGSSDDSVAFVRSTFPSVGVLALEDNLGFSEGCNRGVAAAAHSLVFLLNNDVAVEPDAIEPLVGALTTEPEAFAVCPRMDDWDDRIQCSAIAGDLRWGHLTQEWAVDHPAGDLCAVRAPTLYTSGAAMMFRRDRFDALGGFDTLYEPFYWEDTDLSYRAWKRGWSSWYEPAGRVYHKVSASMGRTSRRKGFLMRRNRYLFHWRNLTDRSAVFWHLVTLPFHIVGALGNAAGQMGTSRGEALWTEARALAAATRRMVQVWQRRRADRPHRVWTDEEVLRRANWRSAAPHAPATRVRYR